jgi:hypothetical protein
VVAVGSVVVPLGVDFDPRVSRSRTLAFAFPVLVFVMAGRGG